jgi:hypothetical protein
MSNYAGDPLGVDIYSAGGFPLRMRLTYGQENLEAALARRLSADEGCLESIGDDPDYGYNLTALIGKDWSPGALAAVGSRIAAEVLKDSRVQSANVTATLTNGTLQITITGTSATGPFGFIANVGQAGVIFSTQQG